MILLILTLLYFEALQLSGQSVDLEILSEDDLEGNDYGFKFTGHPGSYEFSLVATDPYGEFASMDFTSVIYDALNTSPIISIMDPNRV